MLVKVEVGHRVGSRRLCSQSHAPNGDGVGSVEYPDLPLHLEKDGRRHGEGREPGADDISLYRR